ncbi:MAG: potassium channel family protein [Gammaproteobacteria bacterium]|nr:potassium channel family protein [Gammaproteobacteria bacterium]
MNLSFLSLLVALFALIFAAPLIGSTMQFHPIREVLLAAVLVASLFVATHNSGSVRTGILLGLAALFARWLPLLISSNVTAALHSLIPIIFLMFVTWSMTIALAREKRVDFDTVAGGLCIYLLIGLICSLGFTGIAAFDTTAFSYANGQSIEGFPDFLYFSYVTLTTLGYGDITPIAALARSLVLMESIIGQVFMAVFIARLVALYTSQQSKE